MCCIRSGPTTVTILEVWERLLAMEKIMPTRTLAHPGRGSTRCCSVDDSRNSRRRRVVKFDVVLNLRIALRTFEEVSKIHLFFVGVSELPDDRGVVWRQLRKFSF